MSGGRRIEAGQQVWIPDEELAWARGTLTRVQGGQASVQLHAGGETATVAVADCGRFDISHEAYLTDIARMSKLHEGPLLDMLRRRYFEDDIYTFSTEIVIAINPYKVLTGVDDIEAFISKLEAAEAMAEVSTFRFRVAA